MHQKGKERSTAVGVGYGRPWIDQWRPGCHDASTPFTRTQLEALTQAWQNQSCRVRHGRTSPIVSGLAEPALLGSDLTLGVHCWQVVCVCCRLAQLAAPPPALKPR